MWSLNVNIYKAVQRDKRGRSSEVSGRKDVAYGELLFRLMFFGQTKDHAEANYSKFGNSYINKVLGKKKYLYRAYWSHQDQEREL